MDCTTLPNMGFPNVLYYIIDGGTFTPINYDGDFKININMIKGKHLVNLFYNSD